MCTSIFDKDKNNVSSYAYCHDNPVNMIDFNGKDSYYTKNGDFVCKNNKSTDTYKYYTYNGMVKHGRETFKTDGFIHTCSI